MSLEYFSNIVHETVNDTSPSYKITSFPPADDFPIVTGIDGTVISRFGDSYYDYSLICGRPLKISFSNSKRSFFPIAHESSNLLRLFTVYLQFGDVGNLSPRSMSDHVDCLRKVIYFCESKNIDVLELYRYPLVQKELIRWYEDKSPSRIKYLLLTLTKINDGRLMLGFNILGSEELASILDDVNVEHEAIQTAYIPLRIWNYQLNRLTHFLKKYIDHQTIFEQMFDEMLAAYIQNCGSLESATRSGTTKGRSPFSKKRFKSKVYLGSFSDYANKMKVLDVITEIVYPSLMGDISHRAGAKPFGRYLNALSFIGQLLLINLSGMRVSEAASLRRDAFYGDIVSGEKVYFLKGATKKTLRDDNALWVTSEAAEVAVLVMNSISKLRMKVALLDSRVPSLSDEISNPYLLVYGYEPWLPSKIDNSERAMGIRSWLDYSQWRERCPGLFDEKLISITSADLNEALLVTPDLAVDKYGIGEPWPFAYHQLRRTLYVNACQSGLVSEYSGQVQLKHYYLNMTKYYGRNYSSLALNRSVGDEFYVELHKHLARAALELKEENYVSLLSEKHKQSLLRFLQENDVKKLLKLVKEGNFRFRKNLLGLCFSTSPCQYGGFDNIVNCASCTEGLVDKRNLSKLERFIKIVEFEVEHERAGSPRFESLQAQYKIAANAIEVINIG
ncbi:hypothetical protein AB4P93_24755 [Pseudomonas sp. B26140]|uniref:hypothetical protein n=1 Tax=Pseudomonas sp. B26140 TaxID=3235112 RepID=UPI003783B4E6